LVSTVLLGFKLSAAKRLVQVNQRRIELKAALVGLEPKLEAEKLAAWLADVDHDAKQREEARGPDRGDGFGRRSRVQHVGGRGARKGR
jgi:hypothetical protein